jgi:unsaturated chondroitin disaccharide hydrolase
MESQGETEQDGLYRLTHRGIILATALTLTFATWAHADLTSTITGQLSNTVAKLAPNRYPWYTESTGAWRTTDASAWTSGFFPGCLWLMYRSTGDAAWRDEAAAWTSHLKGQELRTNTHDLGFMLLVPGRLAFELTRQDAYRQMLLTAAKSLATRWQPSVGVIKTSYPSSPDGQAKTIIDTLMNVELLFWAASHGGDGRWAFMAQSHARHSAADHVRSDGSTYHVVAYSLSTGAVLAKGTAQGYNTESTWARGQAWAIYGFTMAYRYTGDTVLLEAARKTADYWIRYVPADEVPYWDFEAPNLTTQPRDSSAAAVAASGLLELSALDPDATRRGKYRAQADATLASLKSTAYLTSGPPFAAILKHGTHNAKKGIGVNAGLVYGDFYFMEALRRASGQ